MTAFPDTAAAAPDSAAPASTSPKLNKLYFAAWR